jgi:hypothetical protein
MSSLRVPVSAERGEKLERAPTLENGSGQSVMRIESFGPLLPAMHHSKDLNTVFV